MSYSVYSDTKSALGEGPLWHPTRNQLFWFDIIGMCLHSMSDGEQLSWQFDEHVSAAGWIDHDTLLMASETCLSTFDIETGDTEFICALEADNDVTRSNDGRADPFGGFWIGTMGKNAEAKAGAIYRYYDGALRKVVSNITITNSICFSPDGKLAYYTDTVTDKIMRLNLDLEGWPVGKADLFIKDADHPDGSVVDADGNLWSAQWGNYRVACYAPDGTLQRYVEVGGAQSSCPAFGGPDGTTLFVTTAQQDLSSADLEKSDLHGHVFCVENVAKGQAEHQVIL